MPKRCGGVICRWWLGFGVWVVLRVIVAGRCFVPAADRGQDRSYTSRLGAGPVGAVLTAIGLRLCSVPTADRGQDRSYKSGSGAG